MNYNEINTEYNLDISDQEFKELEESLFGKNKDGDFIEERDLVGKGKDVIQTGKQMKIVNTIATQLRLSIIPSVKNARRFSTGFNPIDNDNEAVLDSGIREFDLTAQPRVFIRGGYFTKLNGTIRKPLKKYLLLFSDVLLITTKKDSTDELYDLEAFIWVKDMKLKYLNYDYMNDETSPIFSSATNISSSSSTTTDDEYSNNQNIIEIISVKTRTRPQLNLYFVCDNESNRINWIDDFETVLLAYHRQTTIIKQIGWYHDIILGNIHSAAYTGDLSLLRKHLRMMEIHNVNVDLLDKSGMSPLHWAVLRSQEVCVRLLLDHGADPDFRQKGMNSSLLLAATRGNESICRLLLDHGADITARNMQDRNAIFLSVLFGHSSKGLPWLLQMLTARGLNLNQIDKKGYTPLHICAERNIVRPIRILVDSGADVNSRHGKTSLTALQMACTNPSPDVETIRSFLDKGAFPNWKDLQGRSALDIILQNQMKVSSSLSPSSSPIPSSTLQKVFSASETMSPITEKPNAHVVISEQSSNISSSTLQQSFQNPFDMESSKYRDMDQTLEAVGIWAVKILPVILEIIKKGGRYNPRDIETLRPSFRTAIEEAKQAWDMKAAPKNFHEFVMSRIQSGEQLTLRKTDWTKDKSSNTCQLCSEAFGMKNRRHHCRACGSLVCDSCSSKRLDLEGLSMPVEDSSSTSAMTVTVTPKRQSLASKFSFKSTPSTPSSTLSTTSSNNQDTPTRRGSTVTRKDERVCDGCFNRLSHEACQPSPEHIRVRQLRLCALDLVHSIGILIDALDEPDGSLDPLARQTESLTRALEDYRFSSVNKKLKFVNEEASGNFSKFATQASMNLSPSMSMDPRQDKSNDEIFIDIIRKREEKLSNCEDIAKKFIEVADGYHRVSKRLIEQRLAASKVWGTDDDTPTTC